MKTTKRILASVLSIVLVLACLSIPALASNKSVTVTTTGRVNMRKGPDQSYAVVTRIHKNVTLVADKYTYDIRGVCWVHTTYKGKSGWISVKNLAKGSKGKVVCNKVTATDGSTYLRSKPTTDSSKLVILKEGKTATYLGKKTKDSRGIDWYKVSYKGKTGWVSSRYTYLY